MRFLSDARSSARAGSPCHRYVVCTWVLVGMLCARVGGQEVEQLGVTSGATSPTTNVGAESATDAKLAIPVKEIAPRAEAAFTSMQGIEGNLLADQGVEAIQQDLPGLAREAGARLEESTRMLASSPALETLRRLEQEWSGVHKEVAEWKRSLQRRVSQLEDDQAQLGQLQREWEATRAAVAKSAKTPPEVVAQVDRVLARVKQTQDKVEAQQMIVLGLQSRVAEQDGRSQHMLNSIESAREAVIRRLFVRDSPPIWSGEVWSESPGALAAQSRHSLGRQVQSLRGYVQRVGGGFALQAALFLVIWFGLVGAGRTLRKLGGEQAGHAARVFDLPAATALVLALLAGIWIYPQAPRLFLAISGAAMIIPAILVVRRLIDRRLYPVLSALVVFYFVDQVRTVAASQAVLSRALLLIEMLAGAVFTGWLLWSGQFKDEAKGNRFWKAVNKGCMVALGWFAAAFLADALGFVSLSKLLGHALLQSAYMALILYAVVRILDGLVLSVMSVPPLNRLGVVKRHKGLLQARTRMVVTWAAAVLWGIYLLDALSVRGPTFNLGRDVLSASLGAGVTLGDVVMFVLVVWASFLVSRMIRFVLEEEVYSRVKLAPGLHYSISKVVNYCILVAGFFIGLKVLRFDLTNLTILIGAFGVGLGFGLQNIINNFVSGLILLFERPIKVGDVVQMEGNEGVVQRIGIRASVVRARNGAELIIPNGNLISQTVTNWTHSDRLRRVDFPVAVVGPVDAGKVMELLKQAALEQERVLKHPGPVVVVSSFTGETVNFELRAWIDQAEEWGEVRSGLAIAVKEKLGANKIAVK
jgi:potassium efflux system protein